MLTRRETGVVRPAPGSSEWALSSEISHLEKSADSKASVKPGPLAEILFDPHSQF